MRIGFSIWGVNDGYSNGLGRFFRKNVSLLLALLAARKTLLKAVDCRAYPNANSSCI
jgi:hypothetical protein